MPASRLQGAGKPPGPFPAMAAGTAVAAGERIKAI